MYEIIQTKKFKTSYKKFLRSGRFDSEEFNKIIEFLGSGSELPEKYHDHILRGNLSGQRECHIRGDVLLIYEIELSNKTIYLGNIGTHSQLFGL